MGRMKSLWGDDAEEFKPERWIDENGFFKPESPFKFSAFQVRNQQLELPHIIEFEHILNFVGLELVSKDMDICISMFVQIKNYY